MFLVCIGSDHTPEGHPLRRDSVSEHIQVTSFSCSIKSSPIPRAAILYCVFQHFQVTSSSCILTSLFIPSASILMCVNQHIQVTTLSCCLTSLSLFSSLFLSLFSEVRASVTQKSSRELNRKRRREERKEEESEEREDIWAWRHATAVVVQRRAAERGAATTPSMRTPSHTDAGGEACPASA